MAIIHQCAKHSIIEADILDGLKLVPNGSVNLIFADAPYNTGTVIYNNWLDKWDSEEAHAAWCYEWLEVALTKLKPNGSIYIMVGTAANAYVDIWLRSRITIKSRIIWHYPSSGSAAKHHFTQLHEPILHCVKNPKNYTFNSEDIAIPSPTGLSGKIDYRRKIPGQYATTKNPSNHWDFKRVTRTSRENEKGCPTIKPSGLIERVIRASSNENDVVLDCFAGSFAFATVAKRLKRKSLSIERDPAYTAVGRRRLNIRKAKKE